MNIDMVSDDGKREIPVHLKGLYVIWQIIRALTNY